MRRSRGNRRSCLNAGDHIYCACTRHYISLVSAGTWPSLQLQSMQLMSHMSSIGKRPRWWTPIRDTIRDAHSSHDTSGQRLPQRTEMMAAYHRLITSSSTTRANHTPHIRPHTVLSIFNCILSPTTSQPLILILLHHHIYYPQPSFIPIV